jgi:hypothetical protein
MRGRWRGLKEAPRCGICSLVHSAAVVDCSMVAMWLGIAERTALLCMLYSAQQSPDRSSLLYFRCRSDRSNVLPLNSMIQHMHADQASGRTLHDTVFPEEAAHTQLDDQGLVTPY